MGHSGTALLSYDIVSSVWFKRIQDFRPGTHERHPMTGPGQYAHSGHNALKQSLRLAQLFPTVWYRMNGRPDEKRSRVMGWAERNGGTKTMAQKRGGGFCSRVCHGPDRCVGVFCDCPVVKSSPVIDAVRLWRLTEAFPER